jgi:hypothetical protein
MGLRGDETAMTARKYQAYTLWMKFRNTGWIPKFTVETGRDQWPSPHEVIESWIKRRYTPEGSNGYWIRGKTWMILPNVKVPAELARMK